MAITFNTKLVDSKIQLNGSSPLAISELGSILDTIKRINERLYSKIGNAGTITAMIEEKDQGNLSVTLTSGTGKLCQILIDQNQANRLKGIAPEPMRLPLPSAATVGKVAGVATGALALYYAPIITGTALFTGAVIGLTSWCMKPSKSKKMETLASPPVDPVPMTADVKAPTASGLVTRPTIQLPPSYETSRVIGIINGGPKQDASSETLNKAFALMMEDLLLSETIKTVCETNRGKHGAFIDVLTAYQQKKTVTPEMLKGLPGTLQKGEGVQQFLLKYIMADSELLAAIKETSRTAMSSSQTEQKAALYCAIASFKSGDNLSATFRTVPGIASVTQRDGNTCFMNAAFQLIMNDPELLKALVETYRQELTRGDLTEAKRNGYSAFLNAVTAYQAGAKDQIDLTPLRQLFYDARSAYVQGDSFEVIQALLGPVKQANYPHLFFRQTIEKRYTQHTPTMWERMSGKIAAKETAIKSSPNWQTERDILPPNRTKRDQPQLTYSFPITLETGEIDGQRLIDRMFTDVARTDQADLDAAAGYFADQGAKDRGDISLWREAFSKTIIDQAPERFMVDLKRFQFSRTGVRSKITREVQMPERATLHGAQYRLKSIVIHSGTVSGGHYYAYIRKGDQWQVANDSTVTATSDISHGLNNGYLYWYERV